MSLLDQINNEILASKESDVVGAALRRVKRRAYYLQTEQSLRVEVALRMALEEEHISLRDIPMHETSEARERRKTAHLHLGNRYLKRKTLFTEEQIRGVLKGYAHLPDKQRAKTILQRFKGRIRPADLHRIMKER